MKYKDLPDDIRKYLDHRCFRYDVCAPEALLHAIIEYRLRYTTTVDGYQYWSVIVRNSDLSIIQSIRDSLDYKMFNGQEVLQSLIQSMKEFINGAS